MREKLEQMGNEERHCFQGKFERCGYKSFDDKYSPTILLTDITDNEGNLVTEHLWFNYCKGFLALGQLEKGDKISFCARVAEYVKGRRYDRSWDYKLSRPTKIKLLESSPRPPMPQKKHVVIGYIMQQNKEFYEAENRVVDFWYIDKYLEWQAIGEQEQYSTNIRYRDERGWLYEVRQHKNERLYKTFYTHDAIGRKKWKPFSHSAWLQTAEEAENNLASYAERKRMVRLDGST